MKKILKQIAVLFFVVLLILSVTACSKHEEHAYGEWEVVTDAICIKDGLKNICVSSAKRKRRKLFPLPAFILMANSL